MASTDPGVAARHPRQEFRLGRVIARAWARARQHPVLLAAALLVVGGGAASAAVALHSSNPIRAVGAECGTGVTARGFHVFACMSGGALAGRPHPKELLVVRADGSSVAYPAFRIGELAVGDGEIVATYNINLVRVTSRRLVPLLTTVELARALHIPRTAIMDIYDIRVAHGDIYFVASVLRRPGWHRVHTNTARSGPGCQNRILERTAGGAIRQLGSSTLPNNTCS